MYSEGYSTRDIAKHFGVGQTTIRRKMEKYGIKARSPKESRKTEAYLNKLEQHAERYRHEYLQKHILTCKNCGKEFTTFGFENKNNKFCSQECKDEFNHFGKIKCVDKNGNETYKTGKEQICKRCGQAIVDNNGDLYTYKRIYCDECAEVYRKEKPTNKIRTNCGYCGAEIEVIPSVFKKNKFNYCDVECMANHYKEIYTGENSPTWKGGKRHYTGNWLRSRDEARKRDEYKCQICGITEDELGHQLSVHHIRLYRLFKDKLEANSLSNLVCLCNLCHSFIHSNQNTEKKYLIER